MKHFQYAWVRDDAQVAVFFSHAQGPNLMQELAQVLGPSLIVPQSSEWVLSLNKQTLNVPYFCGLLGDRGWELVAVSTVPGMGVPSTTMYFKKEISA
jgi:hypothetical protein